MADIGFLCDSDRLDSVCPTAAMIRLPAGQIRSAGADARKVQFLANGEPVGPERYCRPRFEAVLPFERELAVRLDQRRVLRFTDSMRIIVSNTCVCGLGMSNPPNHFYGHYEVVQAARRPTVEPAGKKAKFPWYPEYCNPGFVQV